MGMAMRLSHLLLHWYAYGGGLNSSEELT